METKIRFMEKDNPIFDKKNVLVTGGAGFIGSHLCERLLKDAKVICMDDFSNSSIQNIEHLLQYPDFEFIKNDINNPIDLEEFDELDKFKVKFQGIQEVYHLACPTNIKEFEKLKMNTLWANSKAMISTLDLAVQYKAKYLFASSSIVYGPATEEKIVFTEEQEGVVNHLSPRACYDEGKRFAETCVETYRQVHNLDVKIARIFRTYGPRMRLRSGLFISDFILDALEGRDLEIYGGQEKAQTLCYVSDIVDGMVRFMDALPDVSVMNLGSDAMYRLSDVANKIIELTDSSSKVVFRDPMAFVSRPGVPDLSSAREKLGWLPLIRVEDGLQKTVDYTIANRTRLSL
jgi:UDP-glucuronate decarboxylase